MALLPADIPTGRVVGQFAFLIQDGPDGDTKPDSGAVLGDVTFTCSASIVRFPGKPLTAVPLSFTAEIVNDTLTAKGGSPASDGIELLATDSQLTNPTGFTWNVSFNLRRADNFAPISLPSFDIQVPTNGVVDLTSVMPVSSSGGVITTQGPKGDKGDVGPVGPKGDPGSKQQVIDGLSAAGQLGVTNRVINPSFEVDLTGWQQISGTLTRQTTSLPSWAVGGAIAHFVASGGSTTSRVQARSSDNLIPVVPGDWVAMSALVANQQVAGLATNLRIDWLTSTQTLIGASTSPAFNATGQRYSWSVQAAAPSNAAFAQVYVQMSYNAGAAAVPSGYYVDFDAIMAAKASTQLGALMAVSGYVDGSMPNAYWTGASNNSTSVGVLQNIVPTPLPDGLDWNTITVPGEYAFNNMAGAVNGPGMAQMYGTLTVKVSDAYRIVQTVYPTATQAGARAIYQRMCNLLGAWSTWYVYVATAIDTTAGRNIQIYDYVSNSMRTIAGDTGVRNITSTVPNYTSGTCSLSRNGNEVTLMMSDLVMSGATSGTLDLSILPTGFRPQSVNMQYSTVGAVTTPVRRINLIANGVVRIYSFANTDALTGVFKWTTTEAWPATLPGV